MINCMHSAYKKSARVRGTYFELSREEFFHISQKPCVYCGLPASESLKASTWLCVDVIDTDFRLNGLDRVNNDAGYTTANCASCCKTCNYIKWKLSLPELYNHLKKMMPHLEAVMRKVA